MLQVPSPPGGKAPAGMASRSKLSQLKPAVAQLRINGRVTASTPLQYCRFSLVQSLARAFTSGGSL